MSKSRNLSDLLDSNGDVKSGALDNVSSYTKSDSDPATNTNGSAGDIWINHASGKMYICTDSTSNANVWRNVKDSTDAVYPNTAPTNPSNTASFPSEKFPDNTFTFTFSGATDPQSGYGDSIAAYLVDNISSGNLTVTTAEVSSGTAHSFTVGSITADETVTFRVRAKDSNGAYSSGTTISIFLNSALYVTATGGTVYTDGDYKYHVFTSSGNFVVSDGGNSSGSNTVDALIVAGGGGGAGEYGLNTGAGGGGAGGYLGITGQSVTAQSYYVGIGGGGAGSSPAGRRNGSTGSNSGVFSQTAYGGGYGTTRSQGTAGSGGSGGGGGHGTNGGSGTSGQGNRGGNGGTGYGCAGGGGAGAQGGDKSGGDQPGTNGGIGSNAHSSWATITGTGDSGYFAGGGGGGSVGAYTASGGTGGGGDGAYGEYTNSGSAGSANTGGGGGGGCSRSNQNSSGSSGGSGIVIIRYKYQN